MSAYTALTVTSERPEALKLCQQYVQRQTVPPVEWLIIDDSRVFQPLPDVKHIRRHRISPEPPHTMKRNIAEALKHITTKKVVFFEDDDWYHEKYAENLLPWLEQYDYVGQSKITYYHLGQRKYHRWTDIEHISLCQAGFNISLFREPEVTELLKTETPFLDLELWKLDIKKFALPSDPQYTVGIKGLPGKKGQTLGHYPDGRYKVDRDFDHLQSLIGNDLYFYERFIQW